MFSSNYAERLEGGMQPEYNESEEKFLATTSNSGILYDSRYSLSPSGSTWSSVSVPSWNEQPSSSLYIEKESKEKIIIINQDDNLQLNCTQGLDVPLGKRDLGLKPENQVDVYKRQPSFQYGQQYRQQHPLQPVRINVNTSQYANPSYAYNANSERIPLHPARVSINFPPIYKETGTPSVVFAENKSQTYYENFDTSSQNTPLIIYPRMIRAHQSKHHFVTQNSVPLRSSMVDGFSLEPKDETEQNLGMQSTSLRRTSEMPFRRVHYVNSKPFFNPLNQNSIIYSNIPIQPWETELRMDSRQHLAPNEFYCSPAEVFEENSVYYNNWKYDQRLANDPNSWMSSVFDEEKGNVDNNGLKYISSCSGERYEHFQTEAIQDESNLGYYTSSNHYQQALKYPNKVAVLQGVSDNNIITNTCNNENPPNDKYLNMVSGNPIIKSKRKVILKKVLNKNIQRVQSMEPILSRNIDNVKEFSSQNLIDHSSDSEYFPIDQNDQNQKREVLKCITNSCSIDCASRSVVESNHPNQFSHPVNKEIITEMTNMTEITDKESTIKEMGTKLTKVKKVDVYNEKYESMKDPVPEKIDNSTLLNDADKSVKNDEATTSQKKIETDNDFIDKSASVSNCNASSFPNLKGNKIILDRISSISQEMKAHQLAEWNAKCVYDVYKEVANLKDSANKYLIPACLFFGGVISGHPLLVSEILRRRFCFKMYLQSIYNVISAKRPEIPPDCPPSCYMKHIKDLCEVRDEYTLTSVQKILPLVKKNEIQTPGISQQWAIAVLLIATKITNKTQYDVTYKKLKPFIRTQLLINSYQKILRKRMNSL